MCDFGVRYLQANPCKVHLTAKAYAGMRQKTNDAVTCCDAVTLELIRQSSKRKI